MAAVAFDPLGYTHDLEAAGFSRKQAEVHAKAMTAMFLHNFDALVTTDYLDARFIEFETRLEAKLDKRLGNLEAEMNEKYRSLESEINKQFVGVAQRFDKLDLRFERIGSQFSRIYLMFVITMAAITIPALQSYLGQI